MRSDKDLLSWINSKTGTKLLYIEGAKSGKEICQALMAVTGENSHFPQIERGLTAASRTKNFTLVKSIYENIGLQFKFDIDKLIEGDIDEIKRLIGDLIEIEEEYADAQQVKMDQIDIDEFIGELEKDLESKKREMQGFIKEIDNIAVERDFYFNKLRQVEVACNGYPTDQIETVVKIITTPSADFNPVE